MEMERVPESMDSGAVEGMTRATYMCLQGLQGREGAATRTHELEATMPSVACQQGCRAKPSTTLTHTAPGCMDLQVVLDQALAMLQYHTCYK